MGNMCVQRSKKTQVDWQLMMVHRPAVAPHIKTMLTMAHQNKWSEEQKMIEFTNLCIADWEADLASNRTDRTMLDNIHSTHMQNVNEAVYRYHNARGNEEAVMDALRGLLQVNRDIEKTNGTMRQLEKYISQANEFRHKENANRSREIRKDFAAIAKLVGWLNPDAAQDKNEVDLEIDVEFKEMRDIDKQYRDERDMDAHDDVAILRSMFEQFVHPTASAEKAKDPPSSVACASVSQRAMMNTPPLRMDAATSAGGMDVGSVVESAELAYDDAESKFDVSSTQLRRELHEPNSDEEEQYNNRVLVVSSL